MEVLRVTLDNNESVSVVDLVGFYRDLAEDCAFSVLDRFVIVKGWLYRYQLMYGERPLSDVAKFM